MFTKKVNKFGGIFADSDDECEVITSTVEAEINYQFQEKYSAETRNFREFINQPEFLTGKGDPNTNIVDRNTMFNNKLCTKTYNIPDNKIPKMFKYIELCRRAKVHMMVYERQNEYSGIMFDFDIHQANAIDYINEGILNSITQAFMSTLLKYIDFANPDIPYTEEVLRTYFIYTKKPDVKYDADKKCYKNGFHILVPGVKISREFKRFLINECIENEVFDEILRCIPLAEGYKHSSFIDTNSAHVPVFFVGSSSKTNTPAYELNTASYISVYVEDFENKNKKYPGNFVLSNAREPLGMDVENSPIVLCHELSLNWENNVKTTPVIVKRRYEPKEQYVNLVTNLKGTMLSVEEEETEELGELSLLRIHDPDVDYIMGLLDTLAPFRYVEFEHWFKVLCVLAHTSKSYRPLAETFSMKCESKFNQIDFDTHWNSALANKRNRLNIGSLHFWAKMDNPIKYEEVRQTSIYDTLYKKVYDMQLEGWLQHYDIAKILFKSLRHKYVYDVSGGGSWYEFIIDEDPKQPGEIYKWRPYNKSPSSIKIYTSEILPTLFTRVFTRIDHAIENDVENSKYHQLIKTNLKLTCRKLRDNGFKLGVVKECEQVFERINFSNTLDKDVDVLGVGNGILKLGDDVQFITGYHNYMVSKYTPVDYIPFDPHHPITKKVLYALRNMFPDDEPDTFEFVMCFIASALDGKKKESLLMMLIGAGSNGKSFLMELMKETLSDMAVKMPLNFLTSRPKNSESATPALMALLTARFAYYSETDKFETLHMAKVKEITGQETLTGRKNFGDQVNFKAICHHLVCGNFDFEINGSGHGTWRRLKRVAMRIKFCKESDGGPDPSNPYERLADPSMGSEWPEDPDVKSSFLSILCHYYEVLQNKYNGVVENVPHPNVRKDTEKYRDKQDKINNFINTRFVKTADEKSEVPMTLVLERYTKWHDSLYPGDTEYKKSLGSQFEDTKLTKITTKRRTGSFIVGYRILDTGEEPEPGEVYLMDVMTDKTLKNVSVKPENVDQFYGRLCTEYEIAKKEKAELIKQASKKLYEKKKSIMSAKVEYIKPQSIIQSNANNSINSKNDNNYDKAGFKKSSGIALSSSMIGNIINSDSSDDSDDSSDDEPVIVKPIVKQSVKPVIDDESSEEESDSSDDDSD